MLRRSLALVLAGALALVLTVAVATPVALAQDTPTSGAPAPDIVPEPNSGRAPTEAGDRGGALQLLVLGVVVVAVSGAVVHLTRQSRRARAAR